MWARPAEIVCALTRKRTTGSASFAEKHKKTEKTLQFGICDFETQRFAISFRDFSAIFMRNLQWELRFWICDLKTPAIAIFFWDAKMMLMWCFKPSYVLLVWSPWPRDLHIQATDRQFTASPNSVARLRCTLSLSLDPQVTTNSGLLTRILRRGLSEWLCRSFLAGFEKVSSHGFEGEVVFRTVLWRGS